MCLLVLIGGIYYASYSFFVSNYGMLITNTGRIGNENTHSKSMGVRESYYLKPNALFNGSGKSDDKFYVYL